MAWLCGDKFGQVMPHHESVQALWETVWKRLCTFHAYPFHFAKVEDMELIVDELSRKGINDPYSDKWTETFMPHLRRFEKEAQEAEAGGDYKLAQDLYLRGTTVGMISRFPMINSPLKREAWSLQKKLFLKGTSFWPAPVQNVSIPHRYAANGDGPTLQFLLRRPPQSHANAKSPVLLVFSGLDGYRTDTPPAFGHHAISLGFTTVSMEIPGTGDAPGTPNDPKSSERQLDTILDWITKQEALDETCILVFGTSTGGYNAMRAAHTHHDRLKMVIAQGGASDLAFSKEWLDKADGGEYAFSLTKALMDKLGYESVEKMKEDARDRFSLVKNGIFDGPCTNLLVVNGMKDTIFPIEDSLVVLQHGSPKKARFFPEFGHMGEPGAGKHIMQAMQDFVDMC